MNSIDPKKPILFMGNKILCLLFFCTLSRPCVRVSCSKASDLISIAQLEWLLIIIVHIGGAATAVFTNSLEFEKAKGSYAFNTKALSSLSFFTL